MVARLQVGLALGNGIVRSIPPRGANGRRPRAVSLVSHIGCCHSGGELAQNQTPIETPPDKVIRPGLMISLDQPILEKNQHMPQASRIPPEILTNFAKLSVWTSRQNNAQITEDCLRFLNTVISAFAGESGSSSKERASSAAGTEKKTRAPRGPNKATQSIIACITADTTGKGLTPTMIATATSLAKDVVAKRLASLEKSKQVSQKNGRWIAGTGAPLVVARRQATVTSINVGARKTRIRKTTPTTKSGAISLAAAVLQAVNALGPEAQPAAVMTYLKTNFGMSPRPNHLGISLNRHVTAKRLTKRGNLYSMPSSGYGTQPQGDLAAAG